MRSVLAYVILAATLSSAASILVAQTEAPAAAKSVSAEAPGQAALDARIETLLSMPAEERRAHLKSLAPEERKGLWLKLKKAQFERRDVQPTRNYKERQPRALPTAQNKPLPKAIGTIAYDSGPPTVAFGGGQLVGNRFDTHTGIPVFASGTVSTVVGLVVPGSGLTTSSAGFVLLGPQTGGGGANAIFSTFTTATGTTSTLSFTGLGVNYTGSSFFVLFGDFSSSYIPVFGTGSTLGQGHHGVVGYTGGAFPDITSTFNLGGSLNGFIRATGNIVPVELMTFQID